MAQTKATPSVLDALNATLPEGTKVADIPQVVTLTVTESEGQTRSKFVGKLDDAATVQVNLYLPEGVEFPSDGITLDVGGDGFNPDQSQRRTRKGSVKLAWGDLNDSESFGAAAFLPPKAKVATIVCTK